MTDGDLLARADQLLEHHEPWTYGTDVVALIAELAAAVRARDTELAAARAALTQIAGTRDLEYARTRARHALASVSPPADREEP